MSLRSLASLALTVIASSTASAGDAESRCGAGACGKMTTQKPADPDATRAAKAAGGQDAACGKKDKDKAAAGKDAACGKKDAACGKKDAGCAKK